MARFRQPGSAAMVFMNTLVPTEARLSARARRARRPCRARAMPRQAKTRAAASGMEASRAAMAGRWRAVSAMRYWAVKLTAGAAAAGTSPLGCSRPVTSCGPGEMRNERLRALLLERGKSPDQLAEHVRVDAKTVERWITRGRLPYRRHRFEVASFLGVDEAYIWPDA